MKLKLLLITVVLAMTACEKDEDFDADIGLSSATSEHIGWVVAENSSIYPSVDKIRSGAGNAIAMIVYVGEPGSVDSGSSKYKGLAIALNDASASSGQWSDKSSGIKNGFSTWTDGSATDAATDMNGIEKTKSLSSSGSSAAIRALTYKKGWPGINWFLPSAGQWYKFLNGTCGLTWTDWGWCSQESAGYAKVNDMFKAAGASDAMLSISTYYWTSTEYDADEAVCVRFSSDKGVDAWHFSKNSNRIRGGENGWLNMKVRAFLAF